MINIVVTALLAPKLGAIGAAIAIACGFAVGHELILNIVYARVLKLKLRQFFTACHLRAVPALFVMLVSGFIIAMVWPAGSRLQILLRCAVCGMIYLATVYVLYLNKSEKAYFYGIVRRLLAKIKRK